ncbi:MAG: cobalamin-binding protein [Bacteriovoracaceae bacterium]|nr:cobalamin-binding protein [Bacteriovoracaceae bacterium]
MSFPSKIICLTEETVETLYLLGREDLIAGVSQYVERPPEAKKHPQISQFIRSDVEQIVSLGPDLVIGFSDIQKDIASQLIGRGLNVFVTNQRSLFEILNNILLLGRLIGEEKKALTLVQSFEKKLKGFQEASAKFKCRPKVYFEEWDHPRFSCIKWVSELIYATGGENVFSAKTGAMAREREVSDQEIIDKNPDIIFGCWCGKPVKLDSFAKRAGFEKVRAVQNNFIWELPPAIFLQPGPALFVDGLDLMFEKIQQVANLDV